MISLRKRRLIVLRRRSRTPSFQPRPPTPPPALIHIRKLTTPQQTRESGRAIYVGNKTVIIVGGLQPHSRTAFHRGMIRYKLPEYTYEEEEVGVIPRYGHSCVLWNKKVILFGGVLPTYMRQTMQIYNPAIKTSRFIEKSIDSRRYHTAVVVKDHMLIYGGMSSTGKYLSSAALFSFARKNFIELKLGGSQPGAIVYHSMEAVYPDGYKNYPKFDIFTNPPSYSTIDNEPDRISEIGIYLFGGLKANGVINKNIYVLKTGMKYFHWVKISTNKPAPLPRYKHSMHFSKKQKVLIVFGGITKGESQVEIILDDFWFLYLDKLQWGKVQIRGLHPGPRAGMASCMYGTQILIFGGSKYGADESVYIAELDSNSVTGFIELDNQLESLTQLKVFERKRVIKHRNALTKSAEYLEKERVRESSATPRGSILPRISLPSIF